jgi:predicted ATPase/class 3 adenylate cyclase
VAELPTGTVTFLFTDLESSTRLWEEQPEAMRAALARHDLILTESVEAQEGKVVKGTGDGLHAVFGTAEGAVEAAVACQLALSGERWGVTGPLRVRMGLHTGAAEQRGGDYFGPVLNRAARLMAVAHSGQVLCSQATADLVRDSLAPAVTLLDLGEHRLRDLSRPENVFQVCARGLESEFGPLASLDAFPGNLPVVRTPLVGRHREVGEVSDLLASDRLVTLTGVGGVGKTRLALQVAAEVLDRFPQGVWLVSLAPIRDPGLVPDAVAAAVGIRDQPGRSLIEVLCDALEHRQLLLVLDNCEHVIGAVAQVADQLLDRCSDVRLLATSREALGIDGEYRWPTPSLSVAGRAVREARELVGVEAVQLFVERARAVRRDFAVTSENAAAVAEICDRLDGIPLAIQLAAARVSVLAPQDILRRLDQRFRLLTGGSRTALERHQTMRAAIEWSYALLDETEQQLFQRLSIFSGGFDLGAAEAVATGDAVDQPAVLDLLSGLIAKSMILADLSGASTRYRILETLREFGRDRLVDSGEADGVRTRHARHYVDLAEARYNEMVQDRTSDAYEDLERELDNLRVAHDWLIAIEDASEALRWLLYCGASSIGERAEMLRRCETVLALSDALPVAARADLLMISGWVAFSAGELARARDLAQACLELSEASGLAPNPVALGTLSQVAFWSGDGRRALELIDESIAQGVSDWSTIFGDVRAMQTFILAQLGDTERAIALGEAHLADARRGVGHQLASALWLLGLVYIRRDPKRARELIEESLACNINYQRAWTLVAAGQIRHAVRDQLGAIDAFAQAITLAQTTGDRTVVPVSLEGMARAVRRLGEPLRAIRLFAAAEAARDHLSLAGAVAEATSREHAIDRLKASVADEDFTTAWRAGRKLTFDATIALALDEAAEVERQAQAAPATAP